MSFIKCQSCEIDIEKSSIGYNHYKTPWHAYNVMLRCANKPSLTLENYEKFVANPEKNKTNRNGSFRCIKCNKSFKSKNAFNEHKTTKKHLKKSNLKNSNKLLNFKKLNTKNIKKFIFNCSFCINTGFDDETDILNHLSTCHGFIIPLQEYLKSLSDLLKFIDDKIKIGECIFCERHFPVVDDNNYSVLQHMKQKKHCRMVEISSEFFKKYKKFYNLNSDALTKVAHLLYRDEELELMKNSAGEITLDNGVSLGHRENRIYYKQGFPLEPSSDEEENSENPEKAIIKNFNKTILKNSVINSTPKSCEKWHQKSDLNLCVKANKLHRKKEKKNH